MQEDDKKKIETMKHLIYKCMYIPQNRSVFDFLVFTRNNILSLQYCVSII